MGEKQFKIPLEKEEKTNGVPEIKQPIVVRAETCCLTCGGYKRLRWTERVDGTRVIKEACLYCLCRFHTKQNDEDH
jgi:hypothetical protein